MSCTTSRGGGGVLPYMVHTGMCRWTGYGFRPLCPKQGIQFRASLSYLCESVLIISRVLGLKTAGVLQGQGFKPSAVHLYPNIGGLKPQTHRSEIGWRTLLVGVHPLKIFGLLATGLAASLGWIPSVDVYWTTYPSKIALG